VRGIKTFPLQMLNDFNKRIKNAAESESKTMTDFMLDAIEEKVVEVEKQKIQSR
jgi:uncharacterized protein (DUF1778 family)